jgi:hypothetical protein
MPVVVVSPEKSVYELERDERIKRNAAFLESLGLGPNGDAKLKKKARPSVKKARPSVPLSERRRSARLNDGAGHTPVRLTYDEFSDDERPRKRNRGVRRAVVEASSLSEEERANLGEWDMEAFEEFLTDEHPISEDNRRSVLRQATKLVSGAGVHYASPSYGWPDHVKFREGEPVKITDDIVAITYAAKAFEDEHGRDHGNGWLLNHPLRKLIIYQQHLAVKERDAAARNEA